MKNKYNYPSNSNYIHYTEPNLFSKTNYFLHNHKNKIKTHNNAKNLNRFRSATKINNTNTNKINYLNRNLLSRKADIFDMRIYFCLKMLGLSHLQNIFEKNKINFDELLILSMKDLEMLFIQKNDQIKLKKFSLDYIKNASYYSLDELENYFINKKNINKYRKARSVGNMRKKSMNINNIVNNNNNHVNNNQYYQNFYNTFQNHERFNSATNFKNKYNINRNINNIYENAIINPSYNYINDINSNMNTYALTKRNNDYYNNSYNCNYLTPLNYENKAVIYNKEMIERQNNYLTTNKINKYLSHTNTKNSKMDKNKKMKELTERQKKKVNKIFSNKINSIKNKKNNKNVYNNHSLNNLLIKI